MRFFVQWNASNATGHCDGQNNTISFTMRRARCPSSPRAERREASCNVVTEPEYNWGITPSNRRYAN